MPGVDKTSTGPRATALSAPQAGSLASRESKMSPKAINGRLCHPGDRKKNDAVRERSAEPLASARAVGCEAKARDASLRRGDRFTMFNVFSEL